VQAISTADTQPTELGLSCGPLVLHLQRHGGGSTAAAAGKPTARELSSAGKDYAAEVLRKGECSRILHTTQTCVRIRRLT
jgi:hypothetical protein